MKLWLTLRPHYCFFFSSFFFFFLNCNYLQNLTAPARPPSLPIFPICDWSVIIACVCNILFKSLVRGSGVDCNEVLLRGNCETENWIAEMHFIWETYVREASPYQSEGRNSLVLCWRLSHRTLSCFLFDPGFLSERAVCSTLKLAAPPGRRRRHPPLLALVTAITLENFNCQMFISLGRACRGRRET